MAIKNEDKILKYNGLKTLVKNICDNFARISHKHTKSDITDFPTSMPASDVYSWAKQQNKPTYTKSEVGLGNVENKSSATIRGEITKTNVTSALGYTPYTPNEVDNKLSALETNIDWKESVATYDDIATTYPNPDDGWTVNTRDDNVTYRYDGTSWVAISANAIPKATNSIDGLLSKEDHANYEDANSKKHTHSNKSVIDGISSTNVSNWNSAKTHADSTHARTDATKVESSSTNGNIKINGTETTVYTHPSGTNPHGTTKSDVGLGNVGNFKAVSTVANQGLTDTEKSNARANIGAGTSSFSGSYNDLSNKPTIPSVGNGTVTIKQAGTSKGTFTMNQSGNTTIELTDNNTTYSSKSASSGGTDVSLVTTGEKYIWNSKTSNTGTITGINMNGSSKGTSGVVDLGTVLTGGSQTTTSSADGGSNVYTFSDGSTITVKNGSKGSAGDPGSPGKDGVTPTIKVASGSSIGAVGTPSVTANTSGTTTTFTFNYLKGAKGEKGDPGVNATTTAVATASANGLMSSTDKTNHDTMCTALSDEITEAMVNSLF